MADGDDMTRADTARYLEAMIAEMRGMSVAARFDFLSYLLDMAAMEAAAVRRGVETPLPGQTVRPQEGKPMTPQELEAYYMSYGGD